MDEKRDEIVKEERREKIDEGLRKSGRRERRENRWGVEKKDERVREERRERIDEWMRKEMK